MSNTSYIINYNIELQMLAFSCPDDDDNKQLDLFSKFGYYLANIVKDSLNLSVVRIYKYDCFGVRYINNVQYNELITDIIFLHSEYSNYKNHYSRYLTQEDFLFWQNAIKGVDKPALLKMLYEDKKISEAYLLKYSVYNPSSLYELAKYSVFTHIPVEKASQTEKIDKLSLSSLIKEDLKLNFLR